ncbi:histidinol-phosphatase HisJ family protein [Christensenellaceae bacterium OttesenSCG-928-K19]|nr:histidinol-phosphatase HisJ family protein [Christensenellaceae bacterium OttesenSCG-928-K19]
MFDYHVHSGLSFDGRESISAFCQKALELQLKELCFTEHIELDHIYQTDWDGKVDFDEYSRQIADARKKYPALLIKQGLEAGLQPGNINETTDYLRGKPLDFIVASQHVAKGKDPYTDRDYFRGRPEHEVVKEFLDETSHCLQVFDDFDVVGHLSFATFYSPSGTPLEYGSYAEPLEPLLKNLVERGKGLEANTTGYYIFDAPQASFSVLKRFRELGGEIVTIGSDAHFTIALGHAYQAAAQVLQLAGFRYVCTFSQRQPVFHKL